MLTLTPAAGDKKVDPAPELARSSLSHELPAPLRSAGTLYRVLSLDWLQSIKRCAVAGADAYIVTHAVGGRACGDRVREAG